MPHRPLLWASTKQIITQYVKHELSLSFVIFATVVSKPLQLLVRQFRLHPLHLRCNRSSHSLQLLLQLIDRAMLYALVKRPKRPSRMYASLAQVGEFFLRVVCLQSHKELKRFAIVV